MKKNRLYALIELLLAKAENLNLVKPRDKMFLRNKLQDKLGLEPREQCEIVEDIHQLSLSSISGEIIENLDKNISHILGEQPEIIESNIISALLPLPSCFEEWFNSLAKQTGIEQALNWYYEYMHNVKYINLDSISKNISWNTPTKYGDLDLTINVAKPEKDPHEIAWIKLFEAKHGGHKYPKCLLCIENEGFAGKINHPCRFTNRLISMQLDNQDWFFQFSPYSYYDQHAIIINPQHKDMIIDEQMFRNFFSFVDQVPHYFIGSNSDIPIVGGSILTHDHYQAGSHVFPLEKAKIKFEFNLSKYPRVKISYLNWPVSTIQLTGDKPDLLHLSVEIMEAWYKYNDASLDIVSHLRNKRHNGITPILRKHGPQSYSMYILLRNNLVNDEHPEGIFHPHRDLHHIKKENIGLIEAMGLAVLPGRLATELNEIKKLLLLNNKELAVTELLFDKTLLKHEVWLKELYDKYKLFEASSVDQLLYTETGIKFCQVLQHSGVFKDSPEGDEGALRFLKSIG